MVGRREYTVFGRTHVIITFTLTVVAVVVVDIGIGVGIIDGRRSNAGGGGCHSGHQPLSLC